MDNLENRSSIKTEKDIKVSLVDFSIVVPAFNELENLEPIIDGIHKTMASLEYSYEILIVDDGSTDGSDKFLEDISANDLDIRFVSLSRNFGHMAALTAGLEYARGRKAVVSLDADGQHPPEFIRDMIEQWRMGADIVQSIRRSSRNLNSFKTLTSRSFYALLRFLSDSDLPEGAADFRLMDREVVDALNGLPETDRFLRGLVHWVGFKMVCLPYVAKERTFGSTKYSYPKMLRLAISGITSFTTRPLRLALLAGIIVSLAAFSYAIYIFFCYLFGVALVPGWTSMLLAVLILSGVQLLSIGVLSEYFARMFTEQKKRPVYIVRSNSSSKRR